MSRRLLRPSVWFAALSVVLAASTALAQQPVPYTGRLVESGLPVTGSRTLTLTVYDAATSGTALHSEVDVVDVVDGVFHTYLSPADSVWSGADRWVGVVVNGGAELTPRARIGWVPYAIRTARPSSQVITRPQVLRTVPSGAWVAVDSIEVTAPGPGLVLVGALGTAAWTGSITAPAIAFKISNAMPLILGDYQTAMHSTNTMSLSMTHPEHVSAGTHRYYLWAASNASGQTHSVWLRQFTLTFIPD